MAGEIDLKLQEDVNGLYDISFTASGDFEMVKGFDTSLQISIFGEKRASASEVPNVLQRRGWIGNTIEDDGFEIGSKNWLFEQSRLSNETINGLKDSTLKALEWLIDDELAVNIQAIMSADTRKGSISTTITIEFSSGKVEQRFFTLWENTGL